MNAIRQYFSKIREVAGIQKASDWVLPIFDGNLLVQLIDQAHKGKLVGEDQFGNKYYENPEGLYNRKRWVIYKDKSSYNATSIPPEWHGWINYINDFPPTQYDYRRPVFAIEPYVTKTGTTEYYQPKGAWVNSEKRCWRKHTAWKPPGGTPVQH
eukprot:jgi/Chrzof1/5899/Cz16g19250.t1